MNNLNQITKPDSDQDFINADKPTGFVGLGQMGAGMASVLAGTLKNLLVYDIDPAAVARLEIMGATAATDLKQLGQLCERVFICLPDEVAVENALYGKSGLLSAPEKLRYITDTSTLKVESAQAFAVRVREQFDVTYSDCPVSGLPRRAQLGTLTMMFGGDETEFERVLPYLEVMGEQILYCGDVGFGQMMKAVNNIMYNINIAGFCEVLPLAVKAGLDPLTLEKVVTSGSSRSFASEHFVPRILDRQFDNDFPMQSAYKDIVNFRALLPELGADAPLVDAMIDIYEKTLAAGFGGEPKSAMVKVQEQALKLKIKRPDDTSG